MVKQQFHFSLRMAVSAAIACFTMCTIAMGQQTERMYLSGKGSDDMVEWDFFCTAGMNSGKWTKIGVPSCWELQGFGTYHYGHSPYDTRGKEEGRYKRRFEVPAAWKGKRVNIVFEGVMTDADVTVNGRSAGPTHQGAFYTFRYDISDLLVYGGENVLEVTVAKHSANSSVNDAERKADYWIFGGIFRPVWLEILPETHIETLAVDAKHHGKLTVKAAVNGRADALAVKLFDSDGQPVGGAMALRAGGDGFWGTAQFQGISPWSPESPTLYTAELTLSRDGEAVHRVTQRIGFRTVEVRPRDGIYVNGVKMKFKGVNRHSFRPESGRTTSPRISVEDVELMKAMNMNAVRMAHYPPDGHFLDACDSLGLFVIDELAGWHGQYDTPTGAKLVKEMLEHDRNHPSVIMWANGNEGGHNTALDSLFGVYDIQQRPVIHPWQLHNGIETQHYRQYNYGVGNYENGREIVMPTEFLHGWFDGGHGAGLEDYWHRMWHNPLSAGGFLWDFADQGVVRRDKNDSLDTDKHHGADGIVGPHHEKEGSFYAIKEIWSPLFFERREIAEGFDGTFTIQNRYHFTNANTCSFTWKLKRFRLDGVDSLAGTAQAPDIPPHGRGTLAVPLPEDWRGFDVLEVTVHDRYERELFTWSFPICRPENTAQTLVQKHGSHRVLLDSTDAAYRVQVGDVRLLFDASTGLLLEVANDEGVIPLANGPTIHEGETNFAGFTHRYADDGSLVLSSTFDRKSHYNTLEWTIYPSGWVKMEVDYFPAALHNLMLGVNFSFPEHEIRSVTYRGNGPYRVWKNRLKGNRFGIWTKAYNDTETGESWVYPEFKGYHAQFYGGIFHFADDRRFTVVTETEDLFLRLFTPAWKTDQWNNYETHFPPGDISFMHAVPAIGSRTQTAETTGPMGLKNILYDYEKARERALNMVIYFQFSANQNSGL